MRSYHDCRPPAVPAGDGSATCNAVWAHLRIWLVTIGECLPTDGLVRLLRAGILAQLLAEKGHEVLWWTSAFDHRRKIHRFQEEKRLDIGANLSLWALHGRGYVRNVSLARLGDHRQLAKAFARLAPAEPIPDIILCSLPPIRLPLEATRYAKVRNIPVVMDVRDLWPDVFLDLLPSGIRWIGKILLTRLQRNVEEACSNSAAIFGCTDNYLDWGIRNAGRKRNRFDREFPFGYVDDAPPAGARAEAEAFWDRLGLGRWPTEFIVCWFGTIGQQTELDTAISAAHHLKNDSRKVRLVICGDGEKLGHFRRMAEGCPNVLFPGWVGPAEIWTLMRRSAAGLAVYRSVENFVGHVPNKPIEYLSAGLPIISTLKGTLEKLLAERGCGYTIENGDPENLVRCLCRLYDDPEVRNRMAGYALDLFQEKFTARKVYGEMIDTLEQISKSSR